MGSVAVADRKTLRIDSEVCKGCRICEMACSLAHDGGNGGIKPELSVIKIKDNPEKGAYVPVICRFCDDAPCLDACPLNALFLN